MREELKPCPGNEFVMCKDCLVTTNVFDPCPKGEAVKVWNRRVK